MSRRSFVLFTVVFAMLAFAACVRPAVAASYCPGVYLMQSSNGHDYVAVFSGIPSQRASFDVTVYSAEHAYEFALDDVAIDRPTTEPFGMVRSAPTLFENPSDAPLLAYSADITSSATSTKCSPDRDQIPSVADLPKFHHTPEHAATLRDIVAETKALAAVVTPVLRSDIVVPQCEEPYADAHVIHVVTPTYPVIAAANREVGRTEVKVTINDTGAVVDAVTYKSSGSPALDEAGTKAARATTYAPEIFLCRPIGGNYIFAAEFSGK